MDKPLTRKFSVYVPDRTGGTVKIMFDPMYDRVPSTGQLVNTRELANKYVEEVILNKR